MATCARSKGLHGNKGKFVAERVKSRAVACRPLCLKRSLPAPTKQEQMVHCFKGFSETKEQDQITFPQRGYLQKAFALIKDSSLFSSQHFIHHIGFWGGGEASIVYCASPSSPGTRRASQTIGQQGRCLKCFTPSERQPIYLLLITEGLNSARLEHPLSTTGTIGAAASCLCREKPFPSPEHLQELPAQGKQHSQHGRAAAQEAQKCRAQHNVGLKYGSQVALSPP